MKKITFAVAAYNLAEVSRMVEIAKKAREVFDVEFIHYGGKFEYIIKEEGFQIKRLDPGLTEKKLKYIKTLLNGEALNPVAYFNRKEIRERVAAEIRYFNEVKPVAVLTGWNLTTGISARASGVHYINVLHSTSIQEYYEEGLQSFPDYMDNWFFDLLVPPKKRQAIFNKRVLNARIPIRPFNKVLGEYGLPSRKNFVDYIEGDTTLLADIPSWVNLKSLRSNVHHIGPLPAKLKVPIPRAIEGLDKNEEIVYFAMGSSGKKELVKEIIEGFKGKPYKVIAPIKSLAGDLNINVPSNVIVSGFLPADKVNKMAKVAVLHGGQNTVMNACLSGTPFVGIGMHVEQQANIDACVRKGFAVRLPKNKVKAADVIKAVDRLMKDKEAKKKIDRFRKELEQWDGPSHAVEILKKIVNHKEQI